MYLPMPGEWPVDGICICNCSTGLPDFVIPVRETDILAAAVLFAKCKVGSTHDAALQQFAAGIAGVFESIEEVQ